MKLLSPLHASACMHTLQNTPSSFFQPHVTMGKWTAFTPFELEFAAKMVAARGKDTEHRTEKGGRLKGLSMPVARSYVSALRRVSKQTPLPEDFAWLKKWKVNLEFIETLPLESQRACYTACSTACFTLNDIGGGRGWATVQAKYYAASFKVSARIEKETTTALTAVQTANWVSQADLESKFRVPLFQAALTASTEPLTRATFNALRLYALACLFVASAPPRAAEAAQLWVADAWDSRHMKRDKNYLFTGKNCEGPWSVVFFHHKSAKTAGPVSYSLDMPCDAILRSALQMYVPKLREMLGEATKPVPLFITDRGVQMTSVQVSKTMTEATQALLGVKFASRMARTLFHTTYDQVCLFGDPSSDTFAALSMEERAKRTLHTVDIVRRKYSKVDPSDPLRRPVSVASEPKRAKY